MQTVKLWTLEWTSRWIFQVNSRQEESPTSLAVVQETLNTAKEVAKNYNQQQIIVAYDLSIAKLAMQIRHTQKPEFDDIFINLAAFHTQMAFFQAIGKYIDSSGLIEILIEGRSTSRRFNEHEQ